MMTIILELLLSNKNLMSESKDIESTGLYLDNHFDGLVQERQNSFANTLELLSFLH